MARLELKQIKGTGTDKLVTVDGSGNVIDTFDLTASSIPFDAESSGMVSVDVNAAIIEAYSLAASATLTNPMVADLVFNNGYTIKAANGSGKLNLRDGTNNKVYLTNGTMQLDITPTTWGLTNDTGYGGTANFIQYNGTSLVLNSGSHIDFLVGTMAMYVTGTSLIFGAGGTGGTSVLADFASSTKGLVLPRVANPAGDITTPVAGMIVFNTGTSKFQGYTGSAWQDLN